MTTRYDLAQIRRPLFAFPLAYLVSAALGHALIGLALPEAPPKVLWMAYLPITLLFLAVPYAVLRVALSRLPQAGLPAFAMAGTALGALAMLLTQPGGPVLLLPIGALCGAVVFGIESLARHLRLHWLLRQAAAHPGWTGTLHDELQRAERSTP